MNLAGTKALYILYIYTSSRSSDGFRAWAHRLPDGRFSFSFFHSLLLPCCLEREVGGGGWGRRSISVRFNSWHSFWPASGRLVALLAACNCIPYITESHIQSSHIHPYYKYTYIYIYVCDCVSFCATVRACIYDVRRRNMLGNAMGKAFVEAGYVFARTRMAQRHESIPLLLFRAGWPSLTYDRTATTQHQQKKSKEKRKEIPFCFICSCDLYQLWF